MALLDFPTGPNTNDTTTQNGNTWKWNGTSWVAFNNLSLSSQVSGVLGTLYGGTGKALNGLTVGSVLYADTSTSFAALSPGTSNYVLATQGNGSPPYWKIDDSGTGSVGSGNTGGFAYYSGLNTITSGTAFSYIAGTGAGGTGGTVILTSSTMALIGSTITAGTWNGSTISLAYGGTNNTVSGVGHSYRIAMYDAAGTAITNISTSSGIANSVLFQSSFTSAPVWQGQSQLVVGGATTAARWNDSRTVTFSGGGVTGSFSINGSADVSSVNLNIADNAVALGTKTTGNYAASVAGGGNGLSTIGTAGEGTAFTIHSNATDANTNSTLVFRDGSGNFSAGTITATLSGTATSANAWTNGRTVTFSGGGVTGSFSINGSADVSSVNLNIANDAVALGTKTTGNYATSVAGAGNGLSTIGTAGEGTAFTVHSNATSANTVSTLVFRDGSGNFSAGTITATLSGTATKATNVVGGTASAGSSILIQTGVDTTGFLAHPGSAGQALTTTSNGLVYGALTSLAVTSVSAGTAMQVSGSTGAVTITNNGVHSVSGTTNRINVSGGSGGTGAVTLTLPNTVVVNDIQVDGNSSTLATVGSQPTSIVNKQYVDNLASGLDIHDSVRLVITSAIGASYYQPGYGIGNTATGAYLTSIGNSTFPAFDGVTIGSTGLLQRVLVTGGLTATGKTSINSSALVTPATLAATNLVNGIYYLGSVGSGSSQWYLYRAAETDDNTELTGGTFTFVEEGDLFKDTGWVCTNDTTNLGPIQFGSTAISFSQFTGAAAISFGQGITRVGNTVASNINLSATGAASAIGFTQFNIGGPSVGGAADTGYYPTFSVRTGTIHAGTSLLTLNHTGFSLVGSTNTPATLTVTGNISLPNPGAAGRVAYSSDTNTMAFVGGTAEQILKSNGSSAPSFVDQSTIIAGGATTAARWNDSRTVTFSGGGVTGSFSINGSADVSSVNLNIADNAVALGTKTTGNYAASVAGGGNGLSTIGTAGEGTAFTIHSNATDANTNSTLVFRDGSGNFSAGTITATLSGTATSANAWTNGRTVTFSGGGVTGSFSINGSADVSSVNLNIANDAVALGTKTTGNYATSVAGAGNGLSTIGTAGEGTAFTVHSNATSANTVSTLVFRDGSGNFSAGTITATLSGTATSANAWTSGRTVTFSGGGVTGSFSINGSADVSSVNLNIADNAVALGTKTTGNYTQSVAGAGNGLSTIGTAGEGTDFTVHSNATDAATNSTLVFRNSSGNFSAGTITANLTGTASIASSAAAVSLVSDTSSTLYLLGHRTASGAASSQVYVDTSISISGAQITAGVWAGTAISLANGGTNNTLAGNGYSSKIAVYNAAGTSITAYTHPQGSVIFGATGGTYAGLASTLLPVVSIGSNPPGPAAAIGATQAGQLWWDSEYGVLKIYYSDQGVGVTVNSQWVDATPVLGSSGGASSTKRSYVMTFGAGFTPTIGADSVQIQIPYAPDNTSKYYYIKRLDYRSETTAGGSGVTFFIERHTTGNASFSPTFRIHTAGSGVGASFVVGGSANITSYTLAGTGASFVSSSGVAGSVISGDYLRLNFTAVGSAAYVSMSMILEEQ
jgi:hypothetical protein